MTTPSRLLLPSLMASLLLSACATPQTRIESSPTAFQALTVEQQALVKQGKVAIGFSEEAVKLALGEPHRVSQRTDEKGKSTVWRYVESDSGAVGGFYSDGYYPGFASYGAFGRPVGYSGGFYGPRLTTVNSGGTSAERERLQVVFVDGKVTAIEEQVK